MKSGITNPISNQQHQDFGLLRLAQRAILIATLLISAFLILRDSGIVPAAPMDQHFAETVDLHIRYAQTAGASNTQPCRTVAASPPA